MIVHNVRDGRNGMIGSWECEPLVYEGLGAQHIGRTVIYRDHGRAEAGTISSWRDGIVFARYSRGDTAAGADPTDLLLAVRPAITTPAFAPALRSTPPADGNRS